MSVDGLLRQIAALAFSEDAEHEVRNSSGPHARALYDVRAAIAAAVSGMS